MDDNQACESARFPPLTESRSSMDLCNKAGSEHKAGLMKHALRRLIRNSLHPDRKHRYLGLTLRRIAKFIQVQEASYSRDFLTRPAAAVERTDWPSVTHDKIVYDIGAYNGADISYYLRQGFKVVAVEANPIFAEEIKSKYKDNPRVFAVNACLSDKKIESIPFWVKNVFSTAVQPENHLEYNKIEVSSITPEELFSRYGDPFYVKIDIEGLDSNILKFLMKINIIPPYISAELHDALPLSLLISMGYQKFKITQGWEVHLPYYDLPATSEKPAYRFPEGVSAGPFGEDIPGPWLSPEAIVRLVAELGYGWKDIHAKR